MALFIVERVGTGFSVRPGENTLQAAASALSSQAWAEGTLPGGAGTKSAKEWAGVAEASAEELPSYVGTLIAGPIEPTATAPSFSPTAVFYWPSAKASYDQWLTQIEVPATASGTGEIYVVSDNGDGTVTLVSGPHPVSFAAGANTITVDPIPVPAGCIPGFKRLSASIYYVSGTIPNSESVWQTATVPATSTARTTSTLNGPRLRFTLQAEIAMKSRSAYDRVAVVEGQVGEVQAIGWPSLVGTGSQVGPNYSVILQTPIAAGQDVGAIRIGIGTAGLVRVFTVTVSGGLATVTNSRDLFMTAGVHSIPLNLKGVAGQYVGVALIGTAKILFQSATNPLAIRVWTANAIVGSGTAVSDSGVHRYELAFDYVSGLTGLAQTADGTGENILDVADASGATDATATFASAVAGHPNPLVPPGTFNVTSLPANGGGLWGPGRIFVDGERFFIPRHPLGGNYYDGLRQRLAEHIGAGNVLSLVADSIGHHAFSGTGPQHWFNRLTRFANIGVSKDEPGMTALRPSTNYLPSFYGVTTTGTVSTATVGPILEALRLASGATLSFTGTYESVAVHYQQASGDGTMTIKRGATTIATINANGTAESDKFSGVIATGSTTSETYTIEISGGSVTITNLWRFGLKVAGSQPRLYTNRTARGGYTFASFTSTARAAIIKQGQAFGGKAVPIIALGINDSFGTDPATIRTNAEAVVDAFIAAGVPEIFGVLPIKPTAAMDASYTGGRTFTPAQGVVAEVYRRKGVEILPLPYDFGGSGLFSDGLHPNAEGNDVYAQSVVSGLCR